LTVVRRFRRLVLQPKAAETFSSGQECIDFFDASHESVAFGCERFAVDR